VACGAGVVLLGAALTLGDGAQPAPRHDWRLVVLGIAQDAGMPHLRCVQPPCADARAGKRKAEKVSSLGLIDRTTGRAFIFDATPDFPAQVHALTGGPLPEGVFLTHAHIGHYTGLMYLGKEGVAARGVHVYGTRRMVDFLARNGPWDLLMREGHVEPSVLEINQALELARGLRVTAFPVPHRDEYSDTVGYLIEGPRAAALFVPDTDRWETWTRPIRELADRVDVAFLDGTFSSTTELGGRRIEDVPHPLIPATRERLRGTKARVWFIHLNHTNAALAGGPDIAHEGLEVPL
jgi:pyrroloquinoline quinone biosynthesis protein B